MDNNSKNITFTLNGEQVEVTVTPSDKLVDILREKFHLTGTKKGCGKGECGACTVIMNGQAVNSCIVPALKAAGQNIETIEGVGTPENLHPLQEAFIDLGSVQCGFCIPGMIMSAKALLDNNKSPNKAQIRAAIAGNICRCTGYVKIEEAVEAAAEKIKSNQ